MVEQLVMQLREKWNVAAPLRARRERSEPQLRLRFFGRSVVAMANSTATTASSTTGVRYFLQFCTG